MSQRVLDDSARIRTGLRGFGPVLEEMSQVCDVTALEEQLLAADGRVAQVQERFAAPLSQLQDAVAVSPAHPPLTSASGSAPPHV